VATSRGPGSLGGHRWDNRTRSGATSEDRDEALRVGAGAEGPEGGEGLDGGETARAELLVSHGAEPEKTRLKNGSSGRFIIVKGSKDFFEGGEESIQRVDKWGVRRWVHKVFLVEGVAEGIVGAVLKLVFKNAIDHDGKAEGRSSAAAVMRKRC
jgi:hypothetical protein